MSTVSLHIPEIRSNASENFFTGKQHFLIHVSGTVQGVGFRPFVHRLAHQLGVAGVVCNNSAGVEIHAEADERTLVHFVQELRDQAPAAARVNRVHWMQQPLVGYQAFTIVHSERRAGAVTEVSADLALCDQCRNELNNPANWRHGYPFINCTNCGPRFTIVRSLPYDRPLTTMASFDMCPVCREQYEDPLDRRFHAQPVACPVCGPQISALVRSGSEWQQVETNDCFAWAASELRQGRILLVQGIGGFHLAVDAESEAAIEELRQRKLRIEKPFAVMFASIDEIASCCDVTPAERTLLQSHRAPIVILRRRQECPIAEGVAPGNPQLGCFLAYSPLHVLLLREFGAPLVMTSANLSDEPIQYRKAEALREMSSIADAAVVHNRDIHVFTDDSVTKVVAGAARVWRRARGYVPEPVAIPVSFRVPVLAFGGHLKNTFCIGREDSAILSQYLGDMDNERALQEQQRVLNHFLSLYEARIGKAACDLHPDYATARLAERWSRERSVPLVRVQHHHAHMAACMAENAVSETVTGLCLDGTGFGTDGSVWGGEILVGDFGGFERVAHLETVPMLGGELAAKQPWRMAVAWLEQCFGRPWRDFKLPFVEDTHAKLNRKQLENLLNPRLLELVYPATSSLGRLFDAVAAILFFGLREQYEGQAAMELEWKAMDQADSPYKFGLMEQGSILSPRPMFRALVSDIKNGVAPTVIASRFHEGVAQAFSGACLRVARERNLHSVALSGGCFQNATLLSRCIELLEAEGLRVLSHCNVPTNDGGISLGQACIANAQEH